VQRLIIRLAAAVLAFALGVSAPSAWDARGRIVDVCTELLLNYQD